MSTISTARSTQSPSIQITSRKAERGYRLQAEQWLPQRLDQVFPFFADPFQLEQITPEWLQFRVMTPRPIEMALGIEIAYRLKVHGLPMRWRSVMRVWEPPYRFVDEQIVGPYSRWYHEHTFHQVRDQTRVVDVVDYDVPLRWLTHPFVRRDLIAIFRYRQQRLADFFSADASRLIVVEGTDG